MGRGTPTLPTARAAATGRAGVLDRRRVGTSRAWWNRRRKSRARPSRRCRARIFIERPRGKSAVQADFQMHESRRAKTPARPVAASCANPPTARQRNADAGRNLRRRAARKRIARHGKCGRSIRCKPWFRARVAWSVEVRNPAVGPAGVDAGRRSVGAGPRRVDAGSRRVDRPCRRVAFAPIWCDVGSQRPDAGIRSPVVGARRVSTFRRAMRDRINLVRHRASETRCRGSDIRRRPSESLGRLSKTRARIYLVRNREPESLRRLPEARLPAGGSRSWLPGSLPRRPRPGRGVPETRGPTSCRAAGLRTPASHSAGSRRRRRGRRSRGRAGSSARGCRRRPCPGRPRPSRG